jgi:predicted membrane protein
MMSARWKWGSTLGTVIGSVDKYLYNYCMDYSKNKTTNKTFGTFFCVLFILLAVYFINDGRSFFWYSPLFFLATLFFLMRTFSESSLQPLNNAWYWIGCFIGQYTSGMVFIVIFYLLVSPIAIVGKIFHRDMLRLKNENNVESYWVKPRLDDRSIVEYFRNQF